MSNHRTGTSKDALNAMLDYLHRETQQAKSIDELSDVLELASAIVTEIQTVEPVEGLPNVRVAYTPSSAQRDDANVTTNVPESLVSTFYDLSDKMNELQENDPETFKNAANALHWIANNDKIVS